jgi:hypothetical protein
LGWIVTTRSPFRLPFADQKIAPEADGHRRVDRQLAPFHAAVEAFGVVGKDGFGAGHHPFDGAHQQTGRRAAQFDRVVGQHCLSSHWPPD